MGTFVFREVKFAIRSHQLLFTPHCAVAKKTWTDFGFRCTLACGEQLCCLSHEFIVAYAE